MKSITKAALGGSALSGAAAGGLVLAGVLAASTVTVIGPLAPRAEAKALTQFSSCDALRQWYVDDAVRQVGPEGWKNPLMRIYALDARMESSAARTTVPVAGQAASSTGTNTQHQGVDEPDLAKTDGKIVVQLSGRRIVITDVSGATPHVLGSHRLPRGRWSEGLLLVGHHVVVPTHVNALQDARDSSRPYVGGVQEAEVYDIDISDPTQPRVVSQERYPGTLVSVRQYGETVRVITGTPRPDFDFVQPGKGLTRAEATAQNQQLVRDSTIEDWLPKVKTEVAHGAEQQAGQRDLVGCAEVYRSVKQQQPTDAPTNEPADGPASNGSQDSGASVGYIPSETPADTLVVTGYRVGDGSRSTVGVIGAADEVYSSGDRIVMMARSWGGPIATSPQARSMVRTLAPTATQLHSFALDGTKATYRASGEVDGSVRDRWSIDEYDGHLRVAVGWRKPSGTASENGIVVLDESGGELVERGRVAGLGPNEEIQSVRWLGDLAIVVTFRQVDPLYTVDLSEPTRPRTLGELKIPGFSAYLHPIGEGRLLGLGTDANQRGRSLGAQTAVFDINDPTNTRQLSREAFKDMSFAAATDPHAFTWLPESRTALVTMDRWRGHTEVRPVRALTVNADGSLTSREVATTRTWEARTLPLGNGRVALVGDGDVSLLQVG